MRRDQPVKIAAMPVGPIQHRGNGDEALFLCHDGGCTQILRMMPDLLFISLKCCDKNTSMRYLFTVLLMGFALGFALPAAATQAQEAASAAQGAAKTGESGLPIPRFVSLDSDKVYVRAGPALRYPIRWVYKRKGLPVEIIQEFESWRKIRDFEGEEGWIHTSLLSGKRTVLFTGDDLVPLREGFSANARVVAKIEPRVVAGLSKCIDDWCRVEKDGYKGWVERKSLWGIYDDENLD